MDNSNKPAFASTAATNTTTVTCPACSAQNPADSKFCLYCGKKLQAEASKPAFNNIQSATPQAQFKTSQPKNIASNDDDNEKAAFADALPSWNIEPPVIPVRRKHK